jgi:hypothetical protein
MNQDINKTTKKDVTHSLTKGVIGTIPVIGSLASKVLGLVVRPPLEKMCAKWMNEVAEKLDELFEKQQIDYNE